MTTVFISHECLIQPTNLHNNLIPIDIKSFWQCIGILCFLCINSTLCSWCLQFIILVFYQTITTFLTLFDTDNLLYELFLELWCNVYNLVQKVIRFRFDLNHNGNLNWNIIKLVITMKIDCMWFYRIISVNPDVFVDWINLYVPWVWWFEFLSRVT